MKTIVSIFTLLLMFIVISKSNSIASSRTYEEIINSNEIRMCYVPWLDGQKEAADNGPDFEIAQHFADYLNVKPKRIQIAWNDMFIDKNGVVLKEEAYTPLLFEQQQCDLYTTNIGKYNWRNKKIDTVSFIPSRTLVVVKKKNEAEFESIKNLAGKRTLAIASTSFAFKLKQLNETILKHNPIKLKIVKKGNSLNELLSENIDFTLCDIPLALHLIKKMPNKIALAFPIGKANRTGWGVPKDRAKLKEKVIKFFDHLKKNNKSPLNKIFMKFYGVTRQEYESLFYSLLTNKNKDLTWLNNITVNPINWSFFGERIKDLN